MATQLQLRRGTTAENDVFTGAPGELTMDTDTNGLRIHDGSTAGGITIPTAQTADYVVEWQQPTDLNNYTWYRKYKSGWVEQGGCTVTSSTAGNATSATFAIPMADTSYSAVGSRVVRGTSGNGYQTAVAFSVYTTTGMKVHSGQASCTIAWQVSGMAA